MYVRLGFAVAVNLDPDVLLVDEVLAVGDEVFQRKCLDRIRQFQEEGRTILVVTHGADLVRQVCQRAIVLHHGEMVADAAPGEAIQIFREHLQGRLIDTTASDAVHTSLRVTAVTARSPRGDQRIESGEPLDIEVHYEADDTFDAVTLSLVVRSAATQEVFAVDLDLTKFGASRLQGSGTVRVPLTSVPLLDGTFSVGAVLIDRHHPVPTREVTSSFAVLNPTDSRGIAAIRLGTPHID
jgi:ABC-2 type transport system ATP-binding protein